METSVKKYFIWINILRLILYIWYIIIFQSTPRKVYVFGVILVRIQSECEKIRTRKTPITVTFHAVKSLIDPFHATSLILYPLKTSKTQRFFDVSRSIKRDQRWVDCSSLVLPLAFCDMRVYVEHGNKILENYV